MQKPQIYLLLFLSLLLFTPGCEYFCDCEDEVLCSFSYGNVAFTPDLSGQPQIIKPQFDDPPPAGIYSATPVGLMLDSLTGEIDVNASDYMIEYTITFTPNDSSQSCETSIYIEEPLVTECAFSYEDSVFYPTSDEKVAQIVKPVFADGSEPNGKFTVEPQGLDIDAKTGYFRVNSSVAGNLYTVTYTSADGYVTCSTKVLIQGIDLIDAFLLLQDDIQFQVEGVPVLRDSIVRPVIISDDTTIPAPEGIYQSDDPAVSFPDEGKTGNINLKATINNLEARGVEVFSGFSKEITINYEIFVNDQQVVGRFNFTLYWFEKPEDVPDDLITVMQGKSQYPEQGKTLRPPPVMPAIGGK